MRKSAPLLALHPRRIVYLGSPLVAEELISYCGTLVALAFVGRLGAEALGVFTLAHCITNITGIALLNGLTGAVDTFAAQAHGSRSFAAIGVVLQRALLLSGLACVPLLALFAAMRPLLLLLGQQGRLAVAAARYIQLYAPAVPLHAAVLCMFRTLASQGKWRLNSAVCGVDRQSGIWPAW